MASQYATDSEIPCQPAREDQVCTKRRRVSAQPCAGYAHQSSCVKETYTLAQRYGLVRWDTRDWDTATGTYDVPTDVTDLNILTPGVTGVSAYDPCGFGVNGRANPPTGLAGKVN